MRTKIHYAVHGRDNLEDSFWWHGNKHGWWLHGNLVRPKNGCTNLPFMHTKKRAFRCANDLARKMDAAGAIGTVTITRYLLCGEACRTRSAGKRGYAHRYAIKEWVIEVVQEKTP